MVQLVITEDTIIEADETIHQDGPGTIVRLEEESPNPPPSVHLFGMISGTFSMQNQETIEGVMFGTGLFHDSVFIVEDTGRIDVSVTGLQAVAYGIRATAWASDITNRGEINVTASGNAFGIETNAPSNFTFENSGEIRVTSTEFDAFGVRSGSGNHLNSGLIEVHTDNGLARGLVVSRDVATIENTGSIIVDCGVGAFAGSVGIGVAQDDAVTIINSGLIQSDDVAIREEGATGTKRSVVENTGQVIGDIDLSVGDDAIYNTGGEITGDIILGQGNDVYSTRGALGTLNGAIYGGDGDDLVVGGHGDMTIHGDAGNDSISGGSGNDFLSGGAGFDLIFGGGGNDVVIWDAGDALAGVSGGDGEDVLVFTTPGAPTTFDLAGHDFESAEGRFVDAGAEIWTTQTDYYDALWRLGTSAIQNDDGTGLRIEYDLDSSQNWTSNWSHFAVSGGRDINVLSFNDGHSEEAFYDPDDVEAWNANWNYYQANGGRTINTLTDDDGSYIALYFDPDNTLDWSTNWNSHAANGALLANDLTADDGSKIVVYYDPTNTVNWVSNWNSYDASANLTANAIVYDAGHQVVLYYDPTDAQAWESNWNLYDSEGRLDLNVIENDDGTSIHLDIDASDQFAWYSQWSLYDAGGNLIGFQGVNDDGSTF